MKVLKEGPSPQLDRLKAWTKGRTAMPRRIGDHDLIGSDVESYVVDIDNDGRDEVVVVDNRGSMEAAFYVYRENGTAFAEVPLPEPWSDGVDATGYYNLLTKTGELFISVCGRTYVTLRGRGGVERVTMTWQVDKVVDACDPNWTRFQLTEFEGLYRAGWLDLAEISLDRFLERCRPNLDSDLRVLILDDLATTAIRLGDYAVCTSYIGKARSEPSFSSSSAKAALLNNELWCNTPGPPRRNDFRWLLDPKLRNTHYVSADLRFPALVAATVPEVTAESVQLDPDVRRWAADHRDERKLGTFTTFWLREIARMTLENTYGEAASVTDHRFVALSGCQTHDCGAKGMLWVDVQAGVSAFATNWPELAGLPRIWHREMCTIVASKTLGAGELPSQFRDTFEKWRQTEKIASPCLFYIDGRGVGPVVTLLSGDGGLP